MTPLHLLDVNVLVALAWPQHTHHGAARRWFARTGRHRWATTPVTESGFVRVSANPVAIPDAVRPAEACALLRRVRSLPGHQFLPDDVELVFDEAVDPTRVVTHRQVTDAHLLALATRHGAVLASFDQGLESLAAPDTLALIPFEA